MDSQILSMIPFLLPLVLLQLILFIVALVKWAKKKTLPNRYIWLIVLFFQIVGPIVFLIYSSGKGDDEE